LATPEIVPVNSVPPASEVCKYLCEVEETGEPKATIGFSRAIKNHTAMKVKGTGGEVFVIC
jgi:hypothetical protein